MAPENKIWDTAKILVRKLGEDAPRYASDRAYDWRCGGDIEACEIWSRIVRITQGMLSKEQQKAKRWHEKRISVTD